MNMNKQDNSKDYPEIQFKKEESSQENNIYHDHQHTHSDMCGHRKIKHNDHYDYYVGNQIHHQGNNGCEIHGKIEFKKYFYSSLYKNINHISLKKTKWYKNIYFLRFFTMFILTGGFFLVELIIGIQINSLALQADAFHMASDVLALLIGYYTLHITNREKNDIQTYGWSRSEVIGALINCVFLLSTCFNITLEAIHRLTDIDEIKYTLGNETDKLLIVAAVGLFINIIGLFIFSHGHSHGHSHSHSHSHTHSPTNSNLNVQAVFMHVLGDALGSIGVIISGLIIKYCEGDIRFISDPLCSFFIVFIIIFNTLPIFKNSYHILLQSTPNDINIQEIQQHLQNIPDIISSHDLHVWQLNTDRILATMHIIIQSNKTSQQITDILDQVKLYLHKINIHDSTIQIEFDIQENEKCREPICSQNCPNF